MKQAFFLTGALFIWPGLFLPGLALKAQSEWPRTEVCILWYNAENLFYPSDDSLTADEDFTPMGNRHWTYSRYREKLTRLARVIVAAGRWQAPEVVGLCEVECGIVLEDLVNHPMLKPYEYSYIHRESPDIRGMDVACLFRPGRITLVDWESCASPFFLCSPALESKGKKRATREMLHATFTAGKGDTLDLLLVHLISKYSGAGATALARREQSLGLVSKCVQLRQQHPERLLLLAGDFNETVDGYSLEPLMNLNVGKDTLRAIQPANGPGTYRYQGRWSFIDHFFVLGSPKGIGLSTHMLEYSDLFIEDEIYGGLKPRRTYVGFQYQAGFSDHLPLVLDISLRPSLIAF
jgi:endonuclease/exonuclease/phosphatase family metal-dependent hydrolase